MTIYSNASIREYYVGSRNITVVFGGNALVSLAAANNSIYEIYKNGRLACKGSACSLMRDPDGVITLEPTTLTIIPASPLTPYTATPSGGLSGASYYGGVLSGREFIVALAVAPVAALALALARRVV